MPRSGFLLATACLVAVIPACGPRPIPLAEGKASISLGEPGLFQEVGSQLLLTMQIFNSGEQPLDTSIQAWAGSALQLTDADGTVHLPESIAVEDAIILQPRERRSRDLDLARLFPVLSLPGDYTLTAVFENFRSNSVSVKMIPAFDAAAEYAARVQTDRGEFVLGFFPETAPRHVRNFVNLARAGYYENNVIHRVLPGVMFQTGDPTSTGRGGPGWTLEAEFSDRPHRRGTLSMARQAADPDSAGGQWFVCLDRIPDWDGQYTVFGEVLAGMDVVDTIGNLKVKDEIPLEAVTITRVQVETSANRARR